MIVCLVVVDLGGGGGGGGNINGYQSDMFICEFPRANRTFDDRVQTHDEYQDRVTP